MTRVALAGLLGLSSCVRPARMCLSAPECGGQASCVAGRCVANGAVPSITTARRLLYSPVDMAFVGSGRPAELPQIARVGGADGAVTLLRFSVDLTPEATVLEAYLLLERASEFDSDPAEVALRAARIRDPWDMRSVSWAHRPRLEEVGAPLTRVAAGGGPWVRIDMREIVRLWRRRSRGEFGVAVLGDPAHAGGSGIAIVLAPAAGAVGGTEDPVLWPQGHLAVGPRLELYVR